MLLNALFCCLRKVSAAFQKLFVGGTKWWLHSGYCCVAWRKLLCFATLTRSTSLRQKKKQFVCWLPFWPALLPQHEVLELLQVSVVHDRHLGRRPKCCIGGERGRGCCSNPVVGCEGKWPQGCCSHRNFKMGSYVAWGTIFSNYECSLNGLSYLKDDLYLIFQNLKYYDF